MCNMLTDLVEDSSTQGLDLFHYFLSLSWHTRDDNYHNVIDSNGLNNCKRGNGKCYLGSEFGASKDRKQKDDSEEEPDHYNEVNHNCKDRKSQCDPLNVLRKKVTFPLLPIRQYAV